MVRLNWIKTLVVALAGTGLAWGQPGGVPHPTSGGDHILVIQESEKAPQKCRVHQSWHTTDGKRAHEVQDLHSGERLTIVEDLPQGSADKSRPIPTSIYHWGMKGSRPAGAPVPPGADGQPAVQPAQAISPAGHATGAPGCPCPTGACTPACQTAAPPGGQRQSWGVQPHQVDAAAPRREANHEQPGAAHKPKIQFFVRRREPAPEVKPAAAPGLPAASGRPDPLLAPASYSRRPLEESMPTTHRMDAQKSPSPGVPVNLEQFHAHAHWTPHHPAGPPRAEAPAVQAAAVPSAEPQAPRPYGVQSVMAAGNVNYVPVPIVTMPPTTQMPAPTARPPQPPQPIRPTYVPPSAVTLNNAFKPVDQNLPPGYVPKAPIAVNAFTDVRLPEGSQGAFKTGSAIQPGTVLPRPPSAPPVASKGPMDRGPVAQPLPMNAANAFGGNTNPYYALPADVLTTLTGSNAFTTPAPGTPVPGKQAPRPQTPPAAMMAQGVPAGYGPMMVPGAPIAAGPMGQAIQQVGYYPVPQPAAPAGADARMLQVFSVLRGSLSPSEREYAALTLAESATARTYAPVVQVLLASAREDPAPSVRAECVRCLARLNAGTEPVLAALQALKTDVDARVRIEADQALARFHGPSAPAAQPASASAPAESP